MAHQFAKLAFTDTVKAIQEQQGSRSNYQKFENGADINHHLRDREKGFIEQRDSFYMSTISETGWPYLQHRGGPKGFVRVLDDTSIGFADFSGNRQYITTGNAINNPRVALFFMDYVNRRRLKMLGTMKSVNVEDKTQMKNLHIDAYDQEYPANIERGFIIQVHAFDWNCPQHITQRFTEAEILELQI